MVRSTYMNVMCAHGLAKFKEDNLPAKMERDFAWRAEYDEEWNKAIERLRVNNLERRHVKSIVITASGRTYR